MEQFFGSASALAEFEKMENIQEKIKLMWGLPVSQVYGFLQLSFSKFLCSVSSQIDTVFNGFPGQAVPWALVQLGPGQLEPGARLSQFFKADT